MCDRSVYQRCYMLAVMMLEKPRHENGARERQSEFAPQLQFPGQQLSRLMRQLLLSGACRQLGMTAQGCGKHWGCGGVSVAGGRSTLR